MDDFTKRLTHDGSSDLSFLQLMEMREAMLHADAGGQGEIEDPEGDSVARRTALRRHLYRRASSEADLLDTFCEPVVKPLEKGCCYSFLTRGDIDALSFLKLVTRMQHISYAIVSTWCVDMTDVQTMKKWVDQGKIDRLDLYLGEIYTTGRHGLEAADFQGAFEGYDNVKVAVARNHSKVMAIRGDLFTCVVLTSANINTNPRIESTAILVPDDDEADGLFGFYEDFFRSVKPLTGKP